MKSCFFACFLFFLLKNQILFKKQETGSFFCSFPLFFLYIPVFLYWYPFISTTFILLFICCCRYCRLTCHRLFYCNCCSLWPLNKMNSWHPKINQSISMFKVVPIANKKKKKQKQIHFNRPIWLIRRKAHK